MRNGRVAAVLISSFVLGLSTSSNAQTAAASFEGKPTFKEGKALGYFIWHEGDTWKLRWMTFGSEHKFSGRITVEGGEIQSFKRIDVDKELDVIRPGHRATVVRGARGRAVAVRPGRGAVVAEKTLDKIEQQSETVVQWDTKTNDDLDGVDVKVTNATTGLRFALMIDGKPQPQEVEIGKGNVKPGVNPIRAQIKP